MFNYCAHLYSLEMEEERYYNEMAVSGGSIRSRTLSSPIPYNPSPSSSRPLSPGIFCQMEMAHSD